MKDIDIVREHYNQNPQGEFDRINGRAEFLLAMRFMKRYIKPSDSVLDIGGGPGRYSLTLAKMGCDVTLFDLSPANVEFALAKATEEGVSINAHAGDARYVDEIVSGTLDHILLMGPMYHLLEECDREKAIAACLKLLKPGGKIFVSFISIFGGIIFEMKHMPELIISQTEAEVEYRKAFIQSKSYGGDAFTRAYLIQPHDALSLMEKFPLKKLHFFGQEGLMSPCEDKIMQQPPEVIEGWLNLSEKVCERSDCISYSEHLMYIGEKVNQKC